MKGKIQILHFDPNRLELNVETEQNGRLTYSDVYDPSWKVFVDSRRERMLKETCPFKTVALSAGHHTIKFVYDPLFYKLSMCAYFLGLTVVVAYYLVRFLQTFAYRLG